MYVFYYKIACLFTGLIIIFLGFKLFLRGIFTESGDVEGSWKNLKLIVKKAAPGTYFVLFGSLIISMTIFRGLTSEEFSGYSNPRNPTRILQNDSLFLSQDSIKLK
jgi:hypothetical protein